MEELREFVCYGPWESSLNGDDDGRFELEVDEDGYITGYHYLANEDLANEGKRITVTGTCKHSGHYIELKENRGDTEYFYYSPIIRKDSGNHKTKNGRCRIHGKPKVDDDVWVGVKTAT